MFQHQNIWLPDGEKHFPDWMTKNGELVDGKGTYQIKKWRACLPWIKRWRTAVDVGGHVGLWAMQMAKRFERVRAYEPVAQFRECFNRNLQGVANVSLLGYALGEKAGKVRMKIDPADSGGTHVDPAAESGSVPMYSLDGLMLEDVDFVKIDCEGYEHHVIAGARETLLRYQPCVIVEQKPHKLGPNFGIKGTPAVDLLKAMGAVERAVLSGDHILSW